MSAPVELLLQVTAGVDHVAVVARTPGDTDTRRHGYIGTMTRAELLKTARLFLAGALGEDGVAFLLACAQVGSEAPPEDAASAEVMDRVWQALQMLEVAQAEAAGEVPA